jgi:hypothetical protein
MPISTRIITAGELGTRGGRISDASDINLIMFSEKCIELLALGRLHL